jgi:hypothetical protein
MGRAATRDAAGGQLNSDGTLAEISRDYPGWRPWPVVGRAVVGGAARDQDTG